LRAASSSSALLRALLARLDDSVQAEVADIASLPHYNADSDGGAPVARLIAQVAAADAVLFVTPEYNRSVPAVLKNALDVGSRPYGKNIWDGNLCIPQKNLFY
jgi:chromate reductase